MRVTTYLLYYFLLCEINATKIIRALPQKNHLHQEISSIQEKKCNRIWDHEIHFFSKIPLNQNVRIPFLLRDKHSKNFSVKPKKKSNHSEKKPFVLYHSEERSKSGSTVWDSNTKMRYSSSIWDFSFLINTNSGLILLYQISHTVVGKRSSEPVLHMGISTILAESITSWSNSEDRPHSMQQRWLMSWLSSSKLTWQQL